VFKYLDISRTADFVASFFFGKLQYNPTVLVAIVILGIVAVLTYIEFKH